MIPAMTLQQMFRSLSKEASPCCPISAGQRQWCLPSSAAAAARIALQRMAMVCSRVFDAILSRTVLALPENPAASHPCNTLCCGPHILQQWPGQSFRTRQNIVQRGVQCWLEILANSASLISMLILCRVQLWRLSEHCSRSDIVLEHIVPRD